MYALLHHGSGRLAALLRGSQTPLRFWTPQWPHICVWGSWNLCRYVFIQVSHLLFYINVYIKFSFAQSGSIGKVRKPQPALGRLLWQLWSEKHSDTNRKCVQTTFSFTVEDKLKTWTKKNNQVNQNWKSFPEKLNTDIFVFIRIFSSFSVAIHSFFSWPSLFHGPLCFCTPSFSLQRHPFSVLILCQHFDVL